MECRECQQWSLLLLTPNGGEYSDSKDDPFQLRQRDCVYLVAGHGGTAHQAGFQTSVFWFLSIGGSDVSVRPYCSIAFPFDHVSSHNPLSVMTTLDLAVSFVVALIGVPTGQGHAL